ncbi:MAG TPA: ABC transporter permease [Candidatus Limnocylindrales bacterium]|nr:ABC transporter permease [Candidatus Limnocylindrales bacterium]
MAPVTDAIGVRVPQAQGGVATATAGQKRGRRWGSLVWWLVLLAGVLYFFVPLYATLAFSLRAQPVGAAYANVLNDPGFVGSLVYSLVIGVMTIVVSIAIIVPTAYWVRLRLPRLRPIVEFVTLLPFVIPPVILVFGLLRSYSGDPIALTNSSTGSDILLIAAYVVLSFPYMYRSVDAGLRAIDVRTLTEASQSLGAGWGRILWQVIFPNLRVSLLSGAFLTLAIVIGEFTIATFLVRPAFGPYLSVLGQNRAYEPAAVSLISFGLTWAAMGVIAFLGRNSQQRIQVAGAR